MKRALSILVVLMATLALHSQTLYRCTGDYVNVRTGPGIKYKVVFDDNWGMKVQLFKNVVVQSRGKARNGFIPITCFSGQTASGSSPFDGWVSAQYLKPMTKKCSVCHGKGFFNRPCTDFDGSPETHPVACSCNARFCFHEGCYGKQHCDECGGLGYE